MPPTRHRILISGAGVAGAALTALLTRSGHEVTVVERDQGVRSSGNPVDVRGAAFDVVEGLGLLPRLREAATRVRRLLVVDAAGRPVAALRTQRHPSRALEVPRADLSAALLSAVGPEADVRFDDTVVGLQEEDGGVDVTFARGAPARFDLVVAADGIHSRVRRLALGPERRFVAPLGMAVATVRTPELRLDPTTVRLRTVPGAAVALHPGAGAPGAAFMVRTPEPIDLRDPAAQLGLLTRAAERLGWRAPELLAAYRAADDRWFDVVSRVRTPHWSRGRIVLLGDAASCVTLLGEGSSAAVAGAATLADALDEEPDVAAALARYESRHRPLVRRGQRAAPLASHLLVPATTAGTAVRDRVLRLAGALPHQRGRAA